MYQVSHKASASSSVALAAAKNPTPKESPPPAPSAAPETSAFVSLWRRSTNNFRIPVHYPRYTRAQYEAMDEARLDVLLREYGLPIRGDLAQKRSDAIGHFIW